MKPDPWKEERVNVPGTFNIYRTAKELGYAPSEIPRHLRLSEMHWLEPRWNPSAVKMLLRAAEADHE